MIPPAAAPPKAPIPAPFSRVVSDPPEQPDPRINAPSNNATVGTFFNRLSINNLLNSKDFRPALAPAERVQLGKLSLFRILPVAVFTYRKTCRSIFALFAQPLDFTPLTLYLGLVGVHLPLLVPLLDF